MPQNDEKGILNSGSAKKDRYPDLQKNSFCVSVTIS